LCWIQIVTGVQCFLDDFSVFVCHKILQLIPENTVGVLEVPVQARVDRGAVRQLGVRSAPRLVLTSPLPFTS